jgi:predicted Zn-dependent protease
MAKQFRERNGTFEIPEAQAYLERLVKTLAAALPGDASCCSVELYDRPEAPAKPTAYPGGYLFVPAKLFFTSPSETELILALSHAIAHIKLGDWSAKSVAAAGGANIAPTVIWAGDDQSSTVPEDLRSQFEERERRADEAAERAAGRVVKGTGEFERVRDLAPLPTSRPSLLP